MNFNFFLTARHFQRKRAIFAETTSLLYSILKITSLSKGSALAFPETSRGLFRLGRRRPDGDPLSKSNRIGQNYRTDGSDNPSEENYAYF